MTWVIEKATQATVNSESFMMPEATKSAESSRD